MARLIDRRDFILKTSAAGAACLAGVAGPASARAAERLLGYRASGPAPSRGLAMTPTPTCDGAPGASTPPLTAGPFYTPRTPRRANLVEPGMAGVPLSVAGRVVDRACVPIAGAVLDFWQADAAGRYDNTGFRLRGHQFTDADGGFRLTTIKPAFYASLFSFRTPHIHVKVQGPGTGVLTTQLFFSDETQHNARDGLILPSLIMPVRPDGAGGQRARFDFVLERA